MPPASSRPIKGIIVNTGTHRGAELNTEIAHLWTTGAKHPWLRLGGPTQGSAVRVQVRKRSDAALAAIGEDGLEHLVRDVGGNGQQRWVGGRERELGIDVREPPAGSYDGPRSDATKKGRAYRAPPTGDRGDG